MDQRFVQAMARELQKGGGSAPLPPSFRKRGRGMSIIRGTVNFWG
jgi:hypothetical protein